MRRFTLGVLVVLSLLLGLSPAFAIDNFKNGTRVQVSTGYNAVVTSIDLMSGQGALLATPPFSCTWYNWTDYPDPDDDPNVEVVKVTAVVGDTLTIVRAYEGFKLNPSGIASTHSISMAEYRMDCTLTAKTLQDIENSLPINVKYYGATGDGVTDDTAAIKAAIKASMGTGGSCRAIYFPVGTYYITDQLNFFNTDSSSARDCGKVYGDGRGSIVYWNGPYWKSPIRFVGSFQSFDHLLIVANANWIAGIDYSGSTGSHIGAAGVGRTTTGTLNNIFIDCKNFHGDGIDIGRYGFQSDMLEANPVYITGCIHATGVASFNSNTQSMKFIGGTVAHTHIAFTKFTTTNFTVFGTEIDSNDLNFKLSGGGTVAIYGGRTENPKRVYYDSPGSAAGPRVFESIQFSNITLTRPATATVTSYSTMATPTGLSVTPTGSGATTWGYKIACHDAVGSPNAVSNLSNGHTDSTAEVTATNAAVLDSTHFNTIAFTRSVGASQCIGYRTTAGTTPSTTGAVFIVPNFATDSFVDDGLVADGTTPPTSSTVNPTFVFSASGFVEGDIVAVEGAGAALAANVLKATITGCYDLTHCSLSVDPTVDVTAAQVSLYGDGGTASWTSGSMDVTFTKPIVAGNETIIVAGAGVAGADLTTTLVAASCTFTGTPHNMKCTGSATASTTVTGAIVKSSVLTNWQSFFYANQGGPYKISSNLFQDDHMQFSSGRANNIYLEGNNWTDGLLSDPFGRLNPTCSFVSINNNYGTPPLPTTNCISPALPFSGTSALHSMSVDLTLIATDPTVQVLTPTMAGLAVNLPPGSANVYFLLDNEGSDSLTIKDSGGSTVTSLAGGSAVNVYYNTSWHVW